MRITLAAPPATNNMITVQGGTLPQSSELAGTVVETFRIGKYEVTWSEWQEVQAWAVVNGYPDLEGVGEGASSEHPVMLISCYDAAKWSNAKSEKEGLTPVYLVSGQIFREGGSPGEYVALEVNSSADGYRLPTEAEWEWAARGGINSQGYIYSGSDDADAVAWYGDWEGGPKAVGTKTANELGIYDMSGNAWEWVYDAGRDPTWLRGGNYLVGAEVVAVGSRFYMSTPSYRHDPSTGFRFVRNPAP
jgi:formylglycine-generating enzyme required for sulfatase activity